MLYSLWGLNLEFASPNFLLELEVSAAAVKSQGGIGQLSAQLEEKHCFDTTAEWLEYLFKRAGYLSSASIST